MTEELQILIKAQTEQLEKKIDEATKDIKGFGDTSKKESKKFSESMKAAGRVVGQSLKAVGIALAATATALVALTESTAEYRRNQALLSASFQTAGGSAEDAAKTYNSLYRVLGDDGQATEAAQHLAKLTTNQEDLAEWTNICQGVYATFGASLPIESLTEAANETAKTGTVTGALADALNWAGISEDEFNQKLAACNTEAEREQLIRETLNGTYSDAAANYEATAAQTLAANEAQAKLTNGLAAIATAVEPVITLFKAGLGDTLAELVPFLEMISLGIQNIINGVDGGTEQLTAGLSGLIETVMGKVTEMLPVMLQIGSEVVIAMLNGIVAAFPTLVETLTTLLPTILEAVVALVPQIVTALLEAMPLVIEMLSTMTVSVLGQLSTLLPQILETVIALIPEIIQSFIDNIPVLLDAAIQFLNAIIDAIPIILPVLIDALPTIIKSVVECLIENLPVLLDGAVQLFTALVSAVPEIIPLLLEAMGELLGDLIQYLLDNFNKVGDAIGTALETAGNAALEFVIGGAVGIINGFIDAINFAIGIINGIPGVSIGKLKRLEVPELARGGVVDSATLAVVGERGKEAVVPLENNLEWLDKLAGMLNERMGGGNKPIVLEVDGKVFAQTSINSINALTRQTGNLGLVVV